MASRVPISGRRREEILRFTMVLLAQHGYDNLSFDALARLAKTSKASLYRHWESKFRLVVDAVKDQAARQVDIDLGSFRKEVGHAVLSEDGIFQPGPLTALHALFAAAPRESVGYFDVMKFFWDDNPQMRAMWDRAVSRGEVAANGDRDLIFAGLFHSVYHLTVLRGLKLDSAIVTRVLDNLVMPAVNRERSSWSPQSSEH